jgi:hypothetical protein
MDTAPAKTEPALPVEGYCVFCRTHRPMHGAIQVCNRRGGRDLKGHCGVCGKSMYRLGGWDAVVAAAQQAASRGDGVIG